MSLLCVNDLSVRFDDETAVDKLSFAIGRGESVGLVGESGSGKSMTALAILGLVPPQAAVTGSVLLDGDELLGLPERELDRVRAVRIGIVFQDPLDALNPYQRVGRQLARILLAHGLANRQQATVRVLDMLERVGLPDPSRQASAFPHELSGGMRQRVMIAAALLAEPDLLIADEPTTALDVTVQARILAMLDAIREDTALLLITHDLGIVAGHCERMLVLEKGRLVESGPCKEVFARPKNPYTQSLLAATPRLDEGRSPAPVSADVLLATDKLSVTYLQAGHDALNAVKSVDLDLKVGETVAIVGESGSGKSSLVRAVLGLVPADAGTVVFEGAELPTDLDDRRLTERRDLQLVFQEPAGSLDPQMPVSSIVAEPLSVHRPETLPAERRRLVIEMLAKVGLAETFANRFPHQLSGGQAQRVAIARALILNPKVLVCDEAVAAVDGTVRKKILELLQEIQQSSGLSILFVTHDLGVAQSISHRVAVMYQGEIVELADGEALFRSPGHPYTRALLDAVPVPDPAGQQQSTPTA